MGRSLKVAVIGAGMSGLVVARELKKEGHFVVVFEKADQLGGTWCYDPRVESDPLCLDPARTIIHNSLYDSLRTNLPRHCMGFLDYPFRFRENGDPRTFAGHEEVLRFLLDFANEFGLVELIRFGNEVVRVERADSVGNEWVVESRRGESDLVDELFEAVVVCNGHNTEPVVAQIPGIEKWPGKQVHSHNYRHPSPYENQVVVMIGSGPSAMDISREIAEVAKEVHLASRSPHTIKVFENHPNIWQHNSEIKKACQDGTVQFEDGSDVLADIIFHCTGYTYSFPFLNTNGAISIEDKCAGPLYKHVFPPSLAPWLSFVGIPDKVLVSSLIKLQSKWVAGVLSGKLHLPSKEEMLADVEQYYQYMQECGIPKSHTHLLGLTKFEYQDWLAAQAGVPPIDEVEKSIIKELMKFVVSQQNERFRDEFDVEAVLGDGKT